MVNILLLINQEMKTNFFYIVNYKTVKCTLSKYYIARLTISNYM